MKDMWNDKLNFNYLGDGDLYSGDGTRLFIKKNNINNLQHINDAINDPNSKVFGEDEITEEDLGANGKYIITNDFYRWLASLPNWNTIAKGRFEREMAKRMQN